MCRRKTIEFALVCAAVAGLLCSCPAPAPGGIGQGNGGGTVTPVDTTDFRPAGAGAVCFATNDGRYAGQTGSTVWKIGSTQATPMDELTVKVVKESGCAQRGYGLVFCATTNRFLTLMIDAEGNYTVGVVTGGTTFAYLDPSQPWKSSDALKRGYGQENTLTIKRVASNGTACEFDFLANGTRVYNFVDKDGTPPAGGAYGYICVIGTGSEEGFPDSPVKVTYTQVTPSDIGARGLAGSRAAPGRGQGRTGEMETAI